MNCAPKLLREGGRIGGYGYCAKCGAVMAEGPDTCLGYIPDVRWACCGHVTGDAYVVVGGNPNQSCTEGEEGIDYRSLYGEEALRWMTTEGRMPRGPRP